MASDAAVRQELRNLDSLLLEAYGDGPRQLAVFAERWRSLTRSIAALKQANLLSNDTLLLARTVTQRIAVIAGAFHRVEQAAQQPLFDGQESVADITENQEDSSDDEEDEEDWPGDSLGTGDDEQDDEDPNPPNWPFLREWLLQNMGYPFVLSTPDLSTVLDQGNISQVALEYWVKSVRRQSGWATVFAQHAKSDPENMRRYWSTFMDELRANIDPSHSQLGTQLRQGLTELHNSVLDVFEIDSPPWWDEAASLFMQTWCMPHESGNLEVQEWFSDEEEEEEEEVAVEVTSDFEFEQGIGQLLDQEISALGFGTLSLQPQPETLRQASMTKLSPEPESAVRQPRKRKHTEVIQVFDDPLSAFLPVFDRTFSPPNKRRRLDSPSTSSITLAPSPSAASASSPTIFSPTPGSTPPFLSSNDTLAATPTVVGDSASPQPHDYDPCPPFDPAYAQTPPISIPPTPAPDKLREPAVRPSLSDPTPFIRSTITHNGRKRKRQSATDEYFKGPSDNVLRPDTLDTNSPPDILKSYRIEKTSRSTPNPDNPSSQNTSSTIILPSYSSLFVTEADQTQVPEPHMNKKKRLNPSIANPPQGASHTQRIPTSRVSTPRASSKRAHSRQDRVRAWASSLSNEQSRSPADATTTWEQNATSSTTQLTRPEDEAQCNNLETEGLIPGWEEILRPG